MIAHVALYAHPHPRKVLVIGGGDGGVLREIIKHKTVESVELVEIDETVIKLSRQYLPGMAKGFNDPRVKVHITDGFEFLRSKKDEYDVIISDTSDPDGPAEKLFQVEYFQLVYNALSSQGIASMQASENVWLRLNLLEELQTRCKQVFPVVKYTYACVPTYTSGQLGLMVCCKDPKTDPIVPYARDPDEVRHINQYYNYELHSASFVLPGFARNFIDNGI
jgi:spermidine synthase